MPEFVGRLGRTALKWGALKTEIAALRNCIEARDEKIKELAKNLRQKTDELTRLRNHYQRLGINERDGSEYR